jgi:DNA-binding response OmpR family regulator
MKGKILVADDDPKICALLTDILKENSFRVIVAHTTEDAWEQVIAENPQLILLDVEIPLKGGLEFCRQIKERDPFRQIPVIFLTVRDSEIDKVSGLNLGADDFITKPFRHREVIARIHVVLRRNSASRSLPTFIKSDSLFVDFGRRIVQVNNKDIHLTPKEFEILELLCKNRHRVLNDKMIFDQVWGSHCGSLLSTVYTHMDRLRKKLSQHGIKLKTIPGVGYRFDERVRSG